MNNRALQTAKKMQLWGLIKKVGQLYAEDEDILQEYGKEVYNSNDIDAAISCFQNLIESTKYGIFKEKAHATETGEK